MTKIIVSYDGTAYDEDALALGRVFADAGATVELAYVRHADEHGESEAQIEGLMTHGAKTLGKPKAKRHVVLDASTPNGLQDLARKEKADIVVFGSDSHTARGSVSPQRSTEEMLNEGPVAVAIAPAGYSKSRAKVKRVGVLAEGDKDAEKTAKSLAGKLGAEVTEPGEDVDLFVVGSAPDAHKGRVTLSAAAGYAIETSRTPVIAVPRGAPVSFGRALSRA